MIDYISSAIQELKEEFKGRNKDKTILSNDDYLFGMVCYKYFYNEGKFTYSDYKSSFTDGNNDGGIDLIAVDDNDISTSLVLIQSKNQKSISSKDEVKDMFTKMAQTVKDFTNENTAEFNQKLRKIYREKYDDASSEHSFTIDLVLFVNMNKTEDSQNKIMEHINKVEELNDFNISIYYRNEIEKLIETYKDGKRFVDHGKIDFYKEHGKINLGENGVLVNISALSLRKMFDKYKDQGLFEQNFRYFIRNKKIDSQIVESLQNDRDNFWYKNNGIIIGCKDFYVDGDNVKLEKFSIINGCQTTTILGKYKGTNQSDDFPIVCKIVKPDKDDDSYFNEYIAKIAEASNSQKPISDRDLKSNQPELRKLQRELKEFDPPLIIEIKRGEGVLRLKGYESWQKLKNDLLGQLILSILLQHPGTARSGKRKIFAEFYARIFKRTHDYNTLVDIAKLSSYYDDFINQGNLDDFALNIAKNGKFCVLAILGFFIKYERKLISRSLSPNKEGWVSDISSDNLEGHLFDPERPDNYIKTLYSIFNTIIHSLKNLYQSRGDLETSVTNFFKTDSKYQKVILDHIYSRLISDEYEYNKMQEKINIVFS